MNIIIVGCGKVGQKIAERLSKENQHDITVIDRRENVVQEMTDLIDASRSYEANISAFNASKSMASKGLSIGSAT